MKISLTTVKEKLKNTRFLISAIIIILALLGFVIFQQIQKSKNRQQLPSNIPLPASQQPVINGRFDESAEISQRSKKAIGLLASQLPYKKTLTTSTGKTVNYTIFSVPEDQFELYLDIQNINFQTTYDYPDLPENVQSFRDLASDMFSWMKQNGVNPGDLFILWGSKSFIQSNAEAWLIESPSYPKVISQNGNFVFETPPVR